MRVLFATKHVHFPQGGGGLERNTHELCLRLKRRGITPAVMCSLLPNSSLMAYRNRLIRKLVPHHRFPSDKGLEYAVYRGWESEDGAREVAARFRPDVIVVQSGEAIPILRSFAKLGLPCLLYFHEPARIGDAREAAQMGGVGLLVNSVFMAKRVEEETGQRPAIVRPLVDPSFYAGPVDPKFVLFVNAVPRKGLEIAFRLAEARSDIPFAFVTSWILRPDERRRLEQRAQKAGNIALHPPTNDMRSHYRSARLILMPSQCEEAWGRVVTEAHINGIPVVASAQGGLLEAVGPGGILLAHDAPIADWIEALSKLWDDGPSHARYAEAARDYSRRAEIQPEAIIDAFVAQLARAVAG